MGQVWSTRTNVGSEDITSIALVVDSACQLNVFVGNGIGITPNVDCQTTNRRQKYFDIWTSNQLRVHSIRHPKNALPQHIFRTSKPPRNLRQIPYGFNRHLSHNGLSAWHQYFAIGHEPSGRNCLASFREVDVGLGDGDGWADVEALVDVASVDFGSEVTERINARHLLRIAPTSMRSNVKHWTRQLQIRNVFRVQLPGCYGQPGINAITPAVRSNGIALGGVSNGANDGSAHRGIWMTPRDWDGIDAECVGVGGEVDVVELGDFGNGNAVVIAVAFGGAWLFGGWWGAAHRK
mmetsp:Transcript_20298/g.44126  ORF Transcript_20298/g.44126 Transcript_20298/m.44126 type:complete len:293 (+) Transcript_20298:647-1525(+)